MTFETNSLCFLLVIQFDLAKQFLDPYDNDNQGKGEDPLVIDTLIAETNAGSVRWLNGLAQMPVSAQRFKNAELSDSLLPIRGYTVEELKEMQEEKRVLQAKREREELERKRIEAYELRVQEAADAMIPALFDAGRSGLPGGGTEASDASYGIIFNNTGDRIGLPGGLVAPNFPVVEEVANNLLYSQNVNSTSLQRELIPEGTAPASAYVEEISVVEEEEEPLEMEEPPLEETKEQERIMFGGASFDEEEDDAFEVIQDWGTDTSYVHKFDAFDPYLDLPSLDEVGPDGEEIRFSQILADEQWDEEIEYEKEKDKVRSYAEYVERVAALKDAEAKELQETEEILSASADSRERGDLDTKADSERAKPYDQTKLDGTLLQRTSLNCLDLDCNLTRFFVLDFGRQAYLNCSVYLRTYYPRFQDTKSPRLLIRLNLEPLTSYGVTQDCRLLCRQSQAKPLQYPETIHHLTEYLSCGVKRSRMKQKTCCLLPLRAVFLRRKKMAKMDSRGGTQMACG